MTSVPWRQKKGFGAPRARRNLVTIFYSTPFRSHVALLLGTLSKKAEKRGRKCLSLSTQQQHDMAQLIASDGERQRTHDKKNVASSRQMKTNWWKAYEKGFLEQFFLTLAIVADANHSLRIVMTWTLISFAWYDSLSPLTNFCSKGTQGELHHL